MDDRRERLAREATDYRELATLLAGLGVDGLIAYLTEPTPLAYWYSDSQPVRRALIRGRAALAADPGTLPAVLSRFLHGEEAAVERLRAEARSRAAARSTPPGPAAVDPVAEIEHEDRWIEHVFVLATEGRAVAVGGDGGVTLLDTDTGEALARRDAADETLAVAAACAGNRLYVGDLTGRVVRWDLEADAVAARPVEVVEPSPDQGWEHEYDPAVLSLAALPDGRLVAGTLGGEVRLLDPASGAVAWTGRHDGAVNALAASADGRSVVSGADDATVRVWDTGTGRLRSTLRGHAGSVRAVAITPDGARVVSGGADHTVRLWEGERCVRVLDGAAWPGDPEPGLGPAPEGAAGHWRAVEGVAVTSDGRFAASASADRTVRLWDLDSDAPPAVLTGHRGTVRAVAIGDGLILTGGHDPRLLMWPAVDRLATGGPAPDAVVDHGAGAAAAAAAAAAIAPATRPGPSRPEPDRDLFVSYKSEDVMLVRPVVDALQAAGARLWFAEYDILLAGREGFAAAIAEGVRRSRGALLFTNDRYLASPYCRDEVEQCLAVHGPEGIIEVMVPEEQGSHRAYPSLGEADWTESGDPDRIAAFVARRLGVAVRRRPLPVHHSYRDAAGRHPGAQHSPGYFQDTLAGHTFEIDVRGWTLEKPPRDRRHDPTWLPTFKYAVEQPPLIVNVARGLEIAPEAQRLRDTSDDRAVYGMLLEYAPRHLGALGAEIKGVHLLFGNGLSQMGLTYRSHGFWTRKVSMIVPSRRTRETAEFVFTFAVFGAWEDYCLLTPVMDALATSVVW